MNFKKHFLQGFSLLLLLFAISCKNGRPVTTIPTHDSVVPAPIVKRLFYDSIPKPTGYVNDYEHIFNDDEIDQLEGLIDLLRQETSVQLAIVTFDSTMTTSDGLDALTRQVAATWGIGSKNKNNGMVIGLSKHWRKLRVENGNGTTKMLLDAETKTIVDEDFLPFYKEGKYFEGTKKGLLSLIQKLRGKFTA